MTGKPRHSSSRTRSGSGGRLRPARPAPRRDSGALVERSQQFRLAQEALGIVTWIWEVGSDRVQWHGDIARMLGLATGSVPRFQDYLERVHPDDREHAKKVYEECFRGAIPDYRAQERVVWPDGTEHWLETYGRAHRGADGRTVRMTGAIKNITLRKRQETAARQLEQKFGALFESNPECIVITRVRDARILEVNAAWERYSGYSRYDVIGRSASELRSWADPEDRLAALALLERRGTASNVETQFRRADGVLIDVLISAARIELDGEPCVIWSWRDVSEMRVAERRATQSERKYAALFEVNPQPVMITRVRDSVVLEANAAFEKASGFTRGQVIGRSTDSLGLADSAAVRQRLLERMRAEGEVRDFEMRLSRPDGTAREVLMSAKLIEIDGERCIIWSSHDVGEVRRAKRQARQSESMFLALFEASPEPISVMRLSDGMRLAANAAWERFSGYPRSRATGQPATKMSLFRDPAVRAALIERVVAEGRISSVEARLVRADGKERDAIVSGVTIELEGEPCVIWTWSDVTAERELERTARQSLEKFATLFRTSPVGIAISRMVENDQVIVEANDAALRIAGVTRAETIGAPVSQIVKWVDDEARLAMRARMKAGEYVVDAPLLFQRRDGVIVEALFSGGLLQIDGAPHMVIAFRDVTEQRRIERARQHADARYRAIFESAVDGMVIFGSEGVLLDVNPAVCRMLGYSREEMVGRHFRTFLDAAEVARNPVRTDLSERWNRLEREMPRRGGSPIAMEIVAGPMPDGNVLSILRDITERKRNETLLMNIAHGVSAEVGEAFFRSLVEHLTRELEADYAFIGELIEGPETRVRTLAYVTDGAIAPNFELVLAASPSANAVARRGTVIYEQGVPDLFPHNPGLREKGVQGYVATALCGADGEPLGVLVVMSRRPIARARFWASMIEIFGARGAAEIERARADELVRRMNASLEQRVRERTAELEEANRDLDSYNFSVSHDLRQPLNAIAGFSELLRENLDTAEAEALDYAREIETNAARMEQMIEALLGFARAGRGELQLAEVDMRAQVDGVLHDFASAAPLAARVTVGDLPPARGDAALLRQVWQNLIGNALKYSAKAASPCVEILGARLDDGQVEYRVRDNGVGFDMRHAERLFGVFQRLPTSAGFEGTGVGLAIVQRIVRRHGGQINGESAPGQGATLRFTLPA